MVYGNSRFKVTDFGHLSAANVIEWQHWRGLAVLDSIYFAAVSGRGINGISVATSWATGWHARVFLSS